jgi:zinc protease
LNRKKAPGSTNIIGSGPVAPRVVRLNNSIPFYMVQAGSQPVVRIDLVFAAGSWWQSKSLAAASANTMLSEGTAALPGRDIAGRLDYFGAYLNSSSDRDNAYVSLYSLTRYLDEILPLLEEVVKRPSFPDEEFQVYKERFRQGFLTERGRVSYRAREKFMQVLYGSAHPYGKYISTSDFDNLERADLQKFHNLYYTSDNCRIIVSGKFDEEGLTAKINDLFGGNDWKPEGPKEKGPVKKRPSSKKHNFITLNGSVQSALRIGRELFNKSHPDYQGMLVLNNILGGHFGSRLMQNIREKKGYTYGIGSVLAGMRNSGFLVILSEVGYGYQEASIREIYRELDRLTEKPVSKKELDLTKNQMLGEVLRSFDGPFSWSDSIRNLVEHDLDPAFYQDMVKTIRTISARDLIELARKYLSPACMYEVVAGRK